MFSWFRKHKPKTVHSDVLMRSLFIASGYVYNKPLEEKQYTLVPDKKWVLRNCPVPRQWSKDWDCTKIAIAALAKLQTHAVGAIKVSWPDKENTHALLVIGFENNTVELFDPASRKFHRLESKEIFKLWM